VSSATTVMGSDARRKRLFDSYCSSSFGSWLFLIRARAIQNFTLVLVIYPKFFLTSDLTNRYRRNRRRRREVSIHGVSELRHHAPAAGAPRGDRLPHVAAGRLPCRRRLSRLLRRGRLRRRLVVLPAERPPTVRRR
jgi:hypothetical protein